MHAELELDNRLNVLVVDDDRQLLKGIRRNLQRASCEVEIACDGEGAARALENKVFSVVVLDLQMQPVDGWSVLDQLDVAGGKPAVIVISGHLDVPTTVRLMKAGVDEVIEKPFDPEFLANRVRELARSASSAPARSSEPDAAEELLLGISPEVQLLRQQIRNVARYADLSVLICGETGTGKELVARAVHEITAKGGQQLSINCAAIPENLFESELFGHEAGSFTGSRQSRRGLFEDARDGTLFLDEVGEMHPTLQAKLLRVLESRTFRRLGSNRDLHFTGRVVGATHRSRVGDEAGHLRPDLYYRLASFVISVPPLRKRSADIGVLANHFLERFSERYGSARKGLTRRALEALHAHTWPGNIRELRSVVEQACVASSGELIDATAVASAMRQPQQPQQPVHGENATPPAFEGEETSTLRRLERGLILRAFEESDGNVTEAARRLGIPRSTLRDKLRRLQPAVAKSATGGRNPAIAPTGSAMAAVSKP